MAQLPTGTVTFLFTDIEGSTRLLQRLGADYAEALGQHQALLRAAFDAHDGAEVDTQGDAFFVAFPTAPSAVAAAATATRALADHAWPDSVTFRVRMGLHTGTPQLVGDHYVGLDVHRAARIAAAGHGGQVLLSQTTRDLVAHSLPSGATLRAVGAHRLKDLQEPEPLFQLVLPGLPADFPPLKTLDTFQHNLPLQPTPLLGREEPLAALCALLRSEEVRLVTLTGPGGIGKTRLAVQVAAELVEDFADGVWFVRLSRLVDPTLVVPTISKTLGLHEQGSQPTADTLRAHLADRRLLLVLDNFEQVVGAAAEIGTLLGACPGLKVLATSRIRLRLRGEKTYTMAPLPLAGPDDAQAPERLTQFAAVALFIERARDARSDFAVTATNAPAIAEVCARLDGLPLAIELAAARVRVLPPEALLGRLSTQLKLLTGGARDTEERQQTMRATIAWSEALLAPEERVLFHRLAAFAGGCTLEAAEAVCAAPEGVEPLGLDVLDGLSALVEQSLVQQREEGGEPRFSMLHVIREYALEQLEASGDGEALGKAHAAYYMRFAEQIGWRKVLGTTEPALWLARTERELDNLRAALVWARERGDGETGLRLAAGAAMFWQVTDRRSEGTRWVTEMLALEASQTAAQGLDGSAGATGGLGGRRRTSGSRETPNRELLAARAWALASAASYVADLDQERASALYRDAAATARVVGDVVAVIVAQTLLGILIAVELDERERGTALIEDCLALARQSGEVDAVMWVLYTASWMLARTGAMERAAAWAEEGLALARQHQRPMQVAGANYALAFFSLQRGDLAQARTLATAALQTWLASGSGAFIDAVWLLGLVAGAEGKGERAAWLLGASQAGYARIGVVLPKYDLDEMNAAVAPSREALGEERWAAALAAGGTLSKEEVIAEALREDEDSEAEQHA